MSIEQEIRQASVLIQSALDDFPASGGHPEHWQRIQSKALVAIALLMYVNTGSGK
jgi:hypothetical protein